MSVQRLDSPVTTATNPVRQPTGRRVTADELLPGFRLPLEKIFPADE